MGILNIICLAAGSALSVLFVILLFKGQKYDFMLEPLEGSDYPLKSIYSVGMALQDIRLFSIRGSFGKKLRDNTSLYYGRQYGEYYARVAWAQALSFALLLLSIFLLLAGMSSGSGTAMMLVIALVAAGVSLYYFLTYIGSRFSSQRTQLEAEFPNAISKLALLVNSGVTLHAAWEMVAEGKNGLFYDRMKESCEKMKNGMSEVDAIYEFGIYSGSDDIKKFSTALISSIERGGGYLPDFLVNQSTELWANYRQYVLQKGEKASSALLAPIGLMFGGVIILIVAAAMLGMGM